MELNSKMKGLDECLCSYVLSKDPTRKSSSKSVFMVKKELENFYSKMYNKANQDLKLQQKKSNLNQNTNKLLEKEEHRIREKIYNRTFYSKADPTSSQNLSNKENIKMNKKPMITDNSFKASKLIKGKTSSKFLAQANEELLISEYLEKNQEQRNIKALSHGSSFYKQKGNSKKVDGDFKKMNRSTVLMERRDFDDGMPHRKAELIELYQKLYEQFTKQKTKTINTKSHVQNKFSNGAINLTPQTKKVLQKSLKLATVPAKRAQIKL